MKNHMRRKILLMYIDVCVINTITRKTRVKLPLVIANFASCEHRRFLVERAEADVLP